ADKAMPPTSIPKVGAGWADEAPIDEIMGSLRNSWDTAWGNIKGFDVKVPTDFKPPSPAVIKGLKEFDIAWPTPGQVLKTDDLITLRNQIQQLASQQSGPLGNSLRNRLVAAKSQVDDLLTRNLDPSGKGRGITSKTWRGLNSDEGTEAYRAFMDLQNAAPGNVSRKISPATLETSSAKRAGEGGLAGEGALQELSSQGAQVLTDFPSKQGIFQLGAAMGLLKMAGTPFGVALGPKGMQQFLTAQRGGQKAMQAFVDANEALLREFGLLGRGAAVSAAIED
ncbi:unnamed protein product, partial [marine sediment metagenome]